jgi:uncharacterized protein DUF5672
MPLKLNQVTLCCVDTDHPAAGLRAVRICMSHCQFGRVVYFGPGDFVVGHKSNAEGIEFIPIPSFTSAEIYSRAVRKGLFPYVNTSHVLMVEWDGYVVNPAAWENRFLDFDYIGAVWPDNKEGFRVGNGGFSLRSRKLLEILARPEVPASPIDDAGICIELRPMLESEGIRFADEATASRFAFEQTGFDSTTFGFHGVFNFCRVVPDGELEALLEFMSPKILETKSVLYLIQGYVIKNRWREADMVLRKIEAAFGVDAAVRGLSLIADDDIENAKRVRDIIHSQAKLCR